LRIKKETVMACFKRFLQNLKKIWYSHGCKDIITCTPIARQRVGKEIPAKTDSW
jgi:hypothetical protein